MGESSDTGKLGTLGDAGFFSLGRGKALSVVEGGVILTNRDDLAAVLDDLVGRLPRYGLPRLLSVAAKAAALMVLVHPWLFWLPRSMPVLKLGETLFEPHFPMLRMSALQAGLARNWRAKLGAPQDARRKWVARWSDILEATGIRGPRFPGGQPPALLRFPLRVSDGRTRGILLRESARRGLGIMPAYPTSIDAIPELRGRLEAGVFPVAERCARELVTLPTHGYLTEDDVSAISRLIARLLGERATGSLKAGATLAGQR
jgi:dTDP-4-amino-4,6-dideoxygalactose transaminase